MTRSLLLALLVGCGPSPEQRDLAVTAATVASELDPILLGIYRAENDACLARPDAERVPCVAQVRARWAPVRERLARVRAAWCRAMPEACK